MYKYQETTDLDKAYKMARSVGHVLMYNPMVRQYRPVKPSVCFGERTFTWEDSTRFKDDVPIVLDKPVRIQIPAPFDKVGSDHFLLPPSEPLRDGDDWYDAVVKVWNRVSIKHNAGGATQATYFWYRRSFAELPSQEELAPQQTPKTLHLRTMVKTLQAIVDELKQQVEG